MPGRGQALGAQRGPCPGGPDRSGSEPVPIRAGVLEAWPFQC